MKRLLLFTLLCLPAVVNAQRLSRAYVGAILHDSELGASLTNSFGINKYLGIGAGVDVTSFDSKLIVPVYLDVRGRYMINNIEPMIFGQFGFPLYNKDFGYVDETGGSRKTEIRGKMFYGGGAGVAYKPGKIGVFASYTYRQYKFKYADQPTINGRDLFESPEKGVSAITVGLVF